jgi:hypothetical protein
LRFGKNRRQETQQKQKNRPAHQGILPRRAVNRLRARVFGDETRSAWGEPEHAILQPGNQR